MRGVNKVIIIGNLGADPETRQFNNGGSVTNISVATSEQWTDKQSGEKEATEWHRIALYNRLGEIAAQYLRKGSKVYIEGSLQTRKYQAPDGSDRYSTDIKAYQMQMLDGASGAQGDQSGGYGNSNNQSYGNQGGQNNQPQSNNNQGGGGSYNQGNQGGFNNQGSNNQFNQPAVTNAGAGSKPSAMPDGPVDDDIPF